MGNRRVLASPRWIEDTIAASQRRGLMPLSIEHYPDGTCKISFTGELNASQKENLGWEDVIDGKCGVPRR